MAEAENGQIAQDPELSKQPFRLILHIGAGKTGSTSIQQTLRAHQELLKGRGVWYLGLMLEHAPVRQFPWQVAGDGRAFFALDSGKAAQQALEVLHQAIPAIQARGCREAIWSNEAFFRRGEPALLSAMQQLAAEGIDVQILAFVRRHDAWARSAYVQWGLKHKTYKGPVQSFAQWIKRRPPVFFEELRPWIETLRKRVVVRNFDTVGDVVADFMGIAKISLEGLELQRAHDSPSNEELIFRVLLNRQFTGQVPASFFNQVFGNATHFDVPIDGLLSDLMPSKEALHRVEDACQRDRNVLDELLLASGQKPIDTSPLPDSAETVDPNKVLAAICQLVVNQAVRIHELEKHVNKTDTPNAPASPAVGSSAVSQEVGGQAATAQPVFLISTGRSGSTLVQRLLNCHRDLVLWGEHFGFLNGLANVYVQMANHDQVLYPRRAQDNLGPSQLLPTLQDYAAPLEWVNPWSLEEFEMQLRQFIEGYFASRLSDGQRWGFKEIRYNNLPALRMLRELYPRGKFIFIKRDPIEVTRSKVFAFIKEAKWSGFSDAEKSMRIRDMLNEVRAHYHVYDTFMQRNPGLGLAVDYEELVAHPRELAERMLKHLELDLERFDWSLGDQVVGSVITKTKRDEEVTGLIRNVASTMATEHA